MAAFCGDGFVGPGEQCDEGVNNSNAPNANCRTNCILRSCGDGIFDNVTEECDDGNTINTDACIVGCKNAVCGDGYIRAGMEICDDGNSLYGHACLPPADANACTLNYNIAWVSIAGGSYTIGDGTTNRTPMKQITIQAFEMTRSEITVAQYRQCVQAGLCTLPAVTTGCNWTAAAGAKEQQPINCVTWAQAVAYTSYLDGLDPSAMVYSLPSESEWEYAARSEGMNRTIKIYPWGSTAPSCSRANYINPTNGCGTNSTATVCSRSTSGDLTGNILRTANNGDTVQGLCDMAGNVNEWVADTYLANYNSTPIDGSPVPNIARNLSKVIRGAAWNTNSTTLLNVYRNYLNQGTRLPSTGFRVRRR